MGNVTLVFAQRLRRLMDDRGLTLVEMEKRSGVSKSQISNLLNYKDRSSHHPSTKTVEAIASVFGLQPWQMLRPEGVQDEPEPPLDRDLLTACIAAAAQVFRSRHALPNDTQLAAAAAFLYQRVRDGVTIRNAQAEVAEQLQRLAGDIQEDRLQGAATSGGKRSGRARQRTPG